MRLRTKEVQSNTISQLLSKNIATLGFIGYLPVAPGTFGSLAGFVTFLLIKDLPVSVYILTISAVFVTGVFASRRAEILFKEKDAHCIVIDEFAGFLLSVLFLPKEITYLLSAFILFRFFDILKPPPIRLIERSVKGGLGIMLDDLVAAFYANICIQLWRYLVAN
ncbi:MAG: phosphatidylglycerophosphatase A [Nitrospirae bacterium]|nr:phosphatidylglycerophosphatase A [Nitrospirota bacterium]